MNVLVVGSGGREHALVWKLRQSPGTSKLYCAPGNAGIGQLADIVPVKQTDVDSLLKFAIQEKIDLTVVGPEEPLVEGIVDAFEARGQTIFGPSRFAAMLEGSKVFAKDFMKKNGIPTARYQKFSASELHEASRFIDELQPPIVVKADGLAAGKGVVICETRQHAIDALQAMMFNKEFGNAGERAVVEEFLEGEEASMFVLSDGVRFAPLVSAQDHKRILDGDLGKNTGGMGAYAPAPIVEGEMQSRIVQQVVIPSLEGMKNLGSPYRGCLYFGLMITSDGPRVLEYNCRFGDPEAQVVIPLIKGDLVEILYEIASGNLRDGSVQLSAAAAVCVVMTSKGYPDRYETGKVIEGLDEAAEENSVVVFHAGTQRSADKVVTAGGRVLGVTALDSNGDLEKALEKAYKAVESIAFEGAYFRRDIAQKGLKRMRIMTA